MNTTINIEDLKNYEIKTRIASGLTFENDHKFLEMLMSPYYNTTKYSIERRKTYPPVVFTSFKEAVEWFNKL